MSESNDCFLVNDFGTHRPDVTFIVSKIFDLDAELNTINPLEDFAKDRKFVEEMGIDFGGEAEFLFGDFWYSKKGNACFKIESPINAKDLFIRVKMDFGCGRKNHNLQGGVKYFHQASFGGTCFEYWVLPIGFGCSKLLNKERILSFRNKYVQKRRDRSRKYDASARATFNIVD